MLQDERSVPQITRLARQHDHVTVRIAEPQLTLLSVRIHKGSVNHLDTETLRPSERAVEVVDAKPQQDAIATARICLVTEMLVLVRVPVMKLEDVILIRADALVLVAAVTAAEAQEMLIPATARADVANGDEGLSNH
jgi:hypothetical protein